MDPVKRVKPLYEGLDIFTQNDSPKQSESEINQVYVVKTGIQESGS